MSSIFISVILFYIKYNNNYNILLMEQICIKTICCRSNIQIYIYVYNNRLKTNIFEISLRTCTITHTIIIIIKIIKINILSHIIIVNYILYMPIKYCYDIIEF